MWAVVLCHDQRLPVKRGVAMSHAWKAVVSITLVATIVVAVQVSPPQQVASAEDATKQCNACHHAADEICDLCDTQNGGAGWSIANCVASCQKDNTWDEKPCVKSSEGIHDDCRKRNKDNEDAKRIRDRQHQERLNECHGVKGDKDRMKAACQESCAGIKNARDDCRKDWCNLGPRGKRLHDGCNGTAACKKGQENRCVPPPHRNASASYCKTEKCGLIIKDDVGACCSIECSHGKVATCDCVEGEKPFGFPTSYSPICTCK